MSTYRDYCGGCDKWVFLLPEHEGYCLGCVERRRKAKWSEARQAWAEEEYEAERQAALVGGALAGELDAMDGDWWRDIGSEG